MEFKSVLDILDEMSIVEADFTYDGTEDILKRDGLYNDFTKLKSKLKSGESIVAKIDSKDKMTSLSIMKKSDYRKKAHSDKNYEDANVRIFEDLEAKELYEKEDTEYQKFVKYMAKKKGYKSFDDIPSDKIDDFWNIVDKEWNAEDEPGKDGKIEEFDLEEAKNNLTDYAPKLMKLTARNNHGEARLLMAELTGNKNLVEIVKSINNIINITGSNPISEYTYKLEKDIHKLGRTMYGTTYWDKYIYSNT